MKDWIRRVARLYPREWLERYGDEFDALIDDADAGPRDFLDVLEGALKMQLFGGNYWKIAAVTAVAGAILAGAISVRLPERYVSTAVVKVKGADFADQSLQEILSRSSLAELIQRPSLDLYRGERQRMPMEDLIEQMRSRDIRVQRVGDGLILSFAYRDPETAQAVTRALVGRFLESNVRLQDFRTQVWREIWPKGPAPSAGTVEVLDAASLPVQPAGSNRLAFVAAGTGVGLLLGLLAAVARRRPKSTARMAAFAAVGCAAGVTVAFLLPVTYTSTAVLRLSRPIVSETPDGVSGQPPLAERLLPMQREILSRGSLSQMIQRPALDLYPALRAKEPLEDVVEKMRSKDLMIRPVGESAFVVSFSYPDARKAQAVVRAFVTEFVEQYVVQARQRAKDLKEDDPRIRIQERRAGENLEVLDPASLPESPVAPNRAVITGIGLTLGLLLGALTLWISARSPRRPLPESC